MCQGFARRTRALVWRALFVASWTVTASACGGDHSALAPSVPTSIQITPATVDLAIGDTLQLQARILDQDGKPVTSSSGGTTFTWSSSDTTRLTVTSSGLVRAVRSGSATITVTTGSLHGDIAGTVRALQFQLDAAHAVTEQIPPDGGTIDVQDDAGVTYHLSIPLGALLDTTAITVTPVTGIEDSPFEAVLGAVQFAPDGLVLLTPASLTIELPTPPESGTAFVVFSNDGAAFDYTFGTVSGTTLTAEVPHFSGFGGVRIDPSAPPTPTGSTAEGDAFGAMITEQLIAESEKRPPDPQVIADIFANWYKTAIEPGLKAAAQAEADFLDGIGAWRYWRHEIVDASERLDMPNMSLLLAAQVDNDEPLAAAAFAAQIPRSIDDCFTQRNTIPTKDAFYLQHAAQVWNLVPYEPGLTQEALKGNLCPRVVFATASLPDPLDGGKASQLQVQVGVTFDRTGSGNLMTGAQWPVRLHWLTSGTTNDGAGDVVLTNDGTYQTSLTPSGSADVGVVLDACMDVDVDPPGMLDFTDVCGNTVVQSSVTFTPQVVYERDFNDGSAPGWSPSTVTTSPTGERFLGAPFGNTTVSLTLTDLPAHGSVVVEFDFYALETLDGNHITDPFHPENGTIGPDLITFSMDGTELRTTTFSNDHLPAHGSSQAYPGNYPGDDYPPGTGAEATNTLGYTTDDTTWGNSTYRLVFTVPHTAAKLVFSIQGSNQQGWPNEGWGIDNIRVTTK